MRTTTTSSNGNFDKKVEKRVGINQSMNESFLSRALTQAKSHVYIRSRNIHTRVHIHSYLRIVTDTARAFFGRGNR